MNPTSGSPAECARLAALRSHCGTEEQSEHSKSLIPVPPEALKKALEANGDASDQTAVPAPQSYSESRPLPPQSPSHKPPVPPPSSTASKKLKISSEIYSTTKWGTIQTPSSLSLAPNLTQLLLDKSQAEKILTGELNLNPAFPAPASANNSSSDGALGNLVHLSAKSNLNRLGLRQKIEADGSDALATSVRNKLRNMYGVDGDMGNVIDTVYEGVTTIKDGGSDSGGREDLVEDGDISHITDTVNNSITTITEGGGDTSRGRVLREDEDIGHVINTVDDSVTTIEEGGGDSDGGGDLGEDKDMGLVIDTVDDGVTTIKEGGSDSGERGDLGEDGEMEIEIGEGEGDESDGDGEGTWMHFAIGMGFSTAERMAEIHKMEDIEEEAIEEEDIEEEELEGTTLLHVD
ncbi:MAG: hypothetical protein Q9161_006869 [Pseudevernia consocians]